MTLVVAVAGFETIWLLADRRLTSGKRVVKDDARKVILLETHDGVALLGYAGLGATVKGTEPSDWMSAVMRGRNMSLDRSVVVLSEAMSRELPQHIRSAIPLHAVMAPAFVNRHPTLYGIDLVPGTGSFQCRRLVVQNKKGELTRWPIPLAIGGSGAGPLARDTSWMRPLLRLVRAHDRGALPSEFVADHLARLNRDVHAAVGSVGPRSIVAWRYRKKGQRDGGGGHQFYLGTQRENASESLPNIVQGRDIRALVGAISQVIMPTMIKGELPDVDRDEMNRILRQLPHRPDEKLR